MKTGNSVMYFVYKVAATYGALTNPRRNVFKVIRTAEVMLYLTPNFPIAVLGVIIILLFLIS
jgi:hypothetical protein